MKNLNETMRFDRPELDRVAMADGGTAAPLEQTADPHHVKSMLDLPPKFIDLLPVAAYACDARGHILWFNQRAAELWGRAPRIGDDTERLGGSHRVYFDGRQVGRAQTPMAVALRSGESIHGAEAMVERPDGSRIWATVHVDPVKDAAGTILGAVNCFTDTTELHHARAERVEREAQMRQLLDAMPAAVYTTDAAGAITYYNQAAVKLAGREPTLGSDEWCVTWKLYWPDGTPLPHEECPMALALREKRPNAGMEAIAERPDGTRVPFIPYPTPLFDASGTLIGAVNMLVDITERKHAEQRQHLLMNELVHRSNNLLTVVEAIASFSMSGTRSLAEAREVLEQRIQALARSQDLLVNRAFEGAPMTELVRLEFNGFSNRVKVTGPDVILNPRAAQTFAMLVHELATNAIKHGALSQPAGTIAIDWSIDGAPVGSRFGFRWVERGGPPAAQPTRQGFGRFLIEKAVAQEFGATPSIRFDPEGLSYAIDAPLSAVAVGMP